MLICQNDRDLVRAKLLQGLKRLHQLNEGCIDLMESAVFEGGIVELEMLWDSFLGEDAPDKLKVLGREKKDVS